MTRPQAAVDERPDRPRGRASVLTVAGLSGLVLVCAATLLLGYANKARCAGPVFTDSGRSSPDYDIRKFRDVCYSDIQELWITRDLGAHNIPYLSGGMTDAGALYGGTVEYPVLTGMLIWLGGLAADTDAGFLLGSALLLAPFGLVTAWMLGRLSGWRALLWAASPPLVLYAFHNWDLPVVACAVAAVWVLHGWGGTSPRGSRGRRHTDRPLADRALLAAIALGLGFALKIYPAAFVLPLAAYVLTGGHGGRELPAGGRRYDVVGALRVCGAAALTAVLVNLPFAVFGYQGWRASIEFQQMRDADITSNSIWFWGFRPISDDDSFQAVVNWVSPLAVLGSFVLAMALGWRRYRHEGTYPWVAVSAAMLCGFLLLHKVHSPQYTLWLLPFFVLLQVRWGWIAAYLVADAAVGIGIFRWFYQIDHLAGFGIYDGFAAQAVVIGVWGRAALLVGLFWVLLHARTLFGPSRVASLPPTAIRSTTAVRSPHL